MKIPLFVMTFSTLAVLSTAQSPSIEWQKCLGGTSTDGGAKSAIINTIDDGFLIASTARSNDGDVSGNHGLEDIWVVKLDATGNIEWQKCYGGSSVELGVALTQTSDGAYILCGSTYSIDGDVSNNYGLGDCWVIKIDAAGDIQWQKSFGGSGDDRAVSIIQTMDNGYVFAGSTDSNDGDVSTALGLNDVWVVKLYNNGNVEWEESFGGSLEEGAASVRQTADGGFIVAAGTNSNDGLVTGHHGGADGWIIKLNQWGGAVWENAPGGSTSESFSHLELTSDGGFVASGYTNSTDGDVTGAHGLLDYWVVKCDAAGALQWQKCLGGAFIETPGEVVQTTDGGYVCVTGTFSNDDDVAGNHGGEDGWIVRLDSGGNVAWQKCVGGTDKDRVGGVLLHGDALIAVGRTQSHDGDVSGFHGGSGADLWLVKLSTSSGLTLKKDPSVKFSPNPADEIVHFECDGMNGILILFNQFGQAVKRAHISHSHSFYALPTGLLHYRFVTDGGQVFKGKLLVQR